MENFLYTKKKTEDSIKVFNTISILKSFEETVLFLRTLRNLRQSLMRYTICGASFELIAAPIKC